MNMYCIYTLQWRVVFYVINIRGGKNAPIFDLNILSDRKMNVVGTFMRSKLIFPSSFKKRREKQTKKKR